MPVQSFLQRLKDDVESRRQAGLGRELLPVSSRRGASVILGGRAHLNFSSNDFLGLAQDKEMSSNLAELCRNFGCGA